MSAPDVDVALHLLELRRRQLARLVEDVFGHRQLAGIVQQRGRFDRLQLELVGDAERPRQADRVRLDANHVAVRHVVFRVDGHRERFDRGQVQAIHCRRRDGWRPRRGRTTNATSGERREQPAGSRPRRSRLDLLNHQNQTERQRRRRQIADRQPEKVLPPDRRAGDCCDSSPTAIAVRPELSAK